MDDQTIFWQLYYAFLNHQGGTVNVRRIMAPMFDPETGDAQTAQFYADYDAADPETQDIVYNGIVNAGLYPPPQPAQAPTAPETPPQTDPNAPPTDPNAPIPPTTN